MIDANFLFSPQLIIQPIAPLTSHCTTQLKLFQSFYLYIYARLYMHHANIPLKTYQKSFVHKNDGVNSKLIHHIIVPYITLAVKCGFLFCFPFYTAPYFGLHNIFRLAYISRITCQMYKRTIICPQWNAQSIPPISREYGFGYICGATLYI